MADVVTPEKRSRMMSGIRSKNTKPELIIRKGLYAQGFRYRLHGKGLPGKPDLVLRKHNAVIFVHGCFWHGHECHLFKWPKTRQQWWKEKIERNREKDAENNSALRQDNWRILEIWECALKGKTRRPHEDVLDAVVLWLRSGKSHMVLRGLE